MMRSCTRTNSSPMMWRFCSGSVTPASAARNCSSRVLHGDARHAPHEIGLALAHQAGIDVDAAHAIGSERARAQREGDGGIDAAADEEEDAAVARGLADLLLDQRHAMPRVPIRQAPADAEDEICESTPCRAWCGPPRDGTGRRKVSARGAAMAATAQVPVRPTTEKPAGSAPTESRWLIQICCAPAEAGEQRIVGLVEFQRRQAVLALLALPHFAAEQVRHQLLAVADAEHGLAVLRRSRDRPWGCRGRRRCAGRRR